MRSYDLPRLFAVIEVKPMGEPPTGLLQDDGRDVMTF